MKHSVEQYAQALDLAIGHSSQWSRGEQNRLSERFLRLLERNGDLGKAEAVMRRVREMALARDGCRRVVVETAREADVEGVVKRVSGRGDRVERKITPELVAGVRITVDGRRQLDWSFSRLLREAFHTP